MDTVSTGTVLIRYGRFHPAQDSPSSSSGPAITTIPGRPSPFLQYKQAAFLDPDAAPVGFSTALMQKDLELALALARGVDLALPATAAANELLSIARRHGFADGDLVRVADALRLENPRTGGAAK